VTLRSGYIPPESIMAAGLRAQQASQQLDQILAEISLDESF
jgi:hypothetical protein